MFRTYTHTTAVFFEKRFTISISAWLSKRNRYVLGMPLADTEARLTMAIPYLEASDFLALQYFLPVRWGTDVRAKQPIGNIRLRAVRSRNPNYEIYRLANADSVTR